MTDRKLGVKPPRRLDVSGFEATPAPDPSARTATPAPAKAPKAGPVSQTLATPRPRPRRASKQTSTIPKSKPTSRERTRKAAGRDVRRRVHVTLSRSVADALRSRVDDSGAANTLVLIEAHSTASKKVRPPQLEQVGPFAARRASGGRRGVYFYLSESELDHLDVEAAQAGFESRSAHFDALLEAYLLD